MAIVQWPVFGHHVEFLKGQNFIWRGGLEDRGTSPCKILLQLVHPSARYCDFRCLKMVAVAILEFLFCEILLSDLVHSSETHHLCKIFRFSVFQDGHLGFPNLQNFIIWLQMLPNFVKNQSIRCRDIAIFQYVQLSWLDQRVRDTSLWYIHQNRSIHCRDIAIFRLLFFQDSGHSPSWISLEHIRTTHREYSVVSISVQNLVMIDAVILIIWTFQYLAHLAGKFFFGLFDLLNGLQYKQKPKRNPHHCMSPCHLSHQAWKSGEQSNSTTVKCQLLQIKSWQTILSSSHNFLTCIININCDYRIMQK